MTDQLVHPEGAITYRIFILTLLAICIGIVVFLRSGGGEGFLQDRDRELVLNWKNSQLVLSSAGDAQTAEGGEPLPADLMPIFFRPIPFNEASYDLLLTVPGVGPRTAEEMIKKREEMGRFSKADDLRSIRGIGAKKVLVFEEHFTFE